jgi:hypothetical protein
VNSLREFISRLSESKIHFSAQKIKAYDKIPVSIPLYEFQQIYSNFCQKNGYTEVGDLTDPPAEGVLKQFRMSIMETEGKQVPSYVNIKFKSRKDKMSEQ